MRMRTLLQLGVIACLALPAVARDTLPTPVPTEVVLAGGAPNERLAGKLVAFDEAGITMQVSGKDRVLAWDELTPSSAFNLKFRLLNKHDAQQWLELGRWGWDHGLMSQARSALGSARKLDKALASEIDAILATTPGTSVKPEVTATETPATQPATPADGATPADAAAEETPAMQPGYTGDPQQLIRYTVPTAQENKAQLELIRARADEAQRILETKFTEIATDHFLIFTDWDAREHKFLREQCENAYAILARQFNQLVSGNVFVGKLPIFMFATQKSFMQFAREFDGFGAGETVLGYFHSSPVEQGHMAMWKPGVGTGIGAGGSRDDAMRRWGRTLVHEFAHAFIHRYKSNARIPRWLNEGTAELISEATLPTNNYRSRARSAAMQDIDVMPLFDDTNMPTGAAYPVMMTMAECLQKQSSKKFIGLFDEIKNGTEPEAALRKVYGIRYSQLADGWLKYAKSLK